jgi:tRNA 5-methylaminomethyl-2-thiouridine biosynthesis bifunctional protein
MVDFMAKTFALKGANLNWEAGEPHAQAFDDIYFSRGSGLEESRYVFLTHNQLPQRWLGRDRFTIAETGFGTGLNFLLTWQLWQQQRQPGQQLHFISVEGFPLTREDLAKAHQIWPELQPYSQQLLACYPKLVRGVHRVEFAETGITLTLLFGDANEMLSELQAEVDAWYLDGFDPAKNPEMWNEQLYRQLARLSAPGGTFATFTAAGHVRRGLQGAGFTISKAQGYGKKREMIHGVLAEPVVTTSQAPWFELPPSLSAGRAVVIGAGIAGASTAWQLQRRGWAVTVLDKNTQSGEGASGNPAGAFYPALTADYSHYGRLYLMAYLHALRQFEQWQAAGKNYGWLGSGLLQLGYSDKVRQRQQGIIKVLGECDIAQLLDAKQASEVSGFEQQYGGLFFPEAGWLEPPALCRFMLEKSQATCQYGVTVEGLTQAEQGWQVITDQGEFESDIVVITAGDGIITFAQSQRLPITIARGQISLLPSNKQSEQLQCAVCHEGYLLPQVNRHHVIGASYAPNDVDGGIRLDDQKFNLTQLQEHVASFAKTTESNPEMSNRVGMRATTPDQLPMVGPVPDYEAFKQDYAELHHGRRADSYPTAQHIPGLYVLGGLGSRGLTSALLCSELLACQISGEPLPLEKSLVDAVNPARFLIRELKRR